MVGVLLMSQCDGSWRDSTVEVNQCILSCCCEQQKVYVGLDFSPDEARLFIKCRGEILMQLFQLEEPMIQTKKKMQKKQE